MANQFDVSWERGRWCWFRTQFCSRLYSVWLELYDVKSNIIQFEVLARPSEEELVYRRFKTYGMPVKPRESSIAECEALIRSYPQSIYLPNIYATLLTHLHMSNPAGNSAKIMQVSLEYIDRFPNFGGIKKAVHYYALRLQMSLGVSRHQAPNVEQKRSIEDGLREVQARYPGTRVERYANQKRKKFRAEWSKQK